MALICRDLRRFGCSRSLSLFNPRCASPFPLRPSICLSVRPLVSVSLSAPRDYPLRFFVPTNPFRSISIFTHRLRVCAIVPRNEWPRKVIVALRITIDAYLSRFDVSASAVHVRDLQRDAVSNTRQLFPYMRFFASDVAEIRGAISEAGDSTWRNKRKIPSWDEEETKKTGNYEIRVYQANSQLDIFKLRLVRKRHPKWEILSHLSRLFSFCCWSSTYTK